jgi:peptidoglycan/LPS O-acetylase OafA/YrhL
MRITGLDILRGVAVLLVIFRHASGDNILYEIGWAGVDLFFVLSGFLIAGLVFKEYLATQDFQATRFLVRRGFKIYPPFYFFIIVTVLLHYRETGDFYRAGQVLDEVFFLQSYREGICLHTWSLAVEEHFYLAFAFLSWVCIKRGFFRNNKSIGIVLIGLLLFSFFMRLHVSFENRDKSMFGFTASHLRMDGVLIGVFASYLFHFTDFYSLFFRYKNWFLALAVLLISPVFIFPGGSYIMNTIGLTTVNLGFGLIVLFSLTGFELNNRTISSLTKIPMAIISFIGIHSYSIYLWHLMPAKILSLTDPHLPHYFIRYLILALSLGITMSYVIEKPFLKLRDIIYKRNP